MSTNKTYSQIISESQMIANAIIDNDGEINDELAQLDLANSLEIDAKLESYNYVLQRIDAEAEWCKEAAAGLLEKSKTILNKKAYVKRHLLDSMQREGVSKIRGISCSASITHKETTSVDTAAVMINHGFDIGEIIASANASLAEHGLPFIKLDVKVDTAAFRQFYENAGIVPTELIKNETEYVTIRTAKPSKNAVSDGKAGVSE